MATNMDAKREAGESEVVGCRTALAAARSHIWLAPQLSISTH
jgi:hypothetical protein